MDLGSNSSKIEIPINKIPGYENEDIYKKRIENLDEICEEVVAGFKNYNWSPVKNEDPGYRGYTTKSIKGPDARRIAQELLSRDNKGKVAYYSENGVIRFVIKGQDDIQMFYEKENGEDLFTAVSRPLKVKVNADLIV